MILNKTYYQTLWGKYEIVKSYSNGFKNNSICLTVRMIIRNYQHQKAIHINFQNSKEAIYEIGRHLYIELANDIYLNHYDLPEIGIGSKLRDKRKYVDGRKHDYIIKSISNSNFLLEHRKDKAQINVRYDDLVRKFIPIQQGARRSTLLSYTKFFSDLNNDITLDFTPTHFEKKVVFIAKKALWESLSEKSKIPTIYLPNPREEINSSETKSIPALPDCLIYCTPKYDICYQNLLSKEKKIKAIVVFDTEIDRIEQMLQDKARFGFNLIVISNSLSPIRNQSIPCWDWFKEEIEVVNSL